MTTADIIKFLDEADKSGYANPEAVIATGYDGGNFIEYQNGDWHHRDLFYGGEPYAGQEVVYYQEKAVWAMQYRGWLAQHMIKSGEAYTFLRQALAKGSRADNYRGPASFAAGKFRYVNTWNGSFENFDGAEDIYHEETLCYHANYFGGLVDLPEAKS